MKLRKLKLFNNEGRLFAMVPVDPDLQLRLGLEVVLPGTCVSVNYLRRRLFSGYGKYLMYKYMLQKRMVASERLCAA